MTPSLEFLLECSDLSRQDFQLAALNRAAHLRKRVHESIRLLVHEETNALLAGLVRELKRRVTLGHSSFLDKLLDLAPSCGPDTQPTPRPVKRVKVDANPLGKRLHEPTALVADLFEPKKLKSG